MGKSWKHLAKEDTSMGSKHMRRCQTSLVLSDIKTKSTIRCHCTPIKMAQIRKKGTVLMKMPSNRNSRSLSRGRQNSTSSLEESQPFLTELNTALPYDLAIVLRVTSLANVKVVLTQKLAYECLQQLSTNPPKTGSSWYVLQKVSG